MLPMGCPISKGLAREKGGVIEKGRKILELVPPTTRAGARDQELGSCVEAGIRRGGPCLAGMRGVEAGAGRRGCAVPRERDSAQRERVVQVPQCPALVQTQWSLGANQRARLNRDAAYRLGGLAFLV